MALPIEYPKDKQWRCLVCGSDLIDMAVTDKVIEQQKAEIERLKEMHPETRALIERDAEIERLTDELINVEAVAKERYCTMQTEIERLRAENAKLQAVVDAQREYHERNLRDARAYRADPSHRCDWRVRIEAIESRSRAALAALEEADDE